MRDIEEIADAGGSLMRTNCLSDYTKISKQKGLKRPVDYITVAQINIMFHCSA
jgi:hypothetical protein